MKFTGRWLVRQLIENENLHGIDNPSCVIFWFSKDLERCNVLFVRLASFQTGETYSNVGYLLE